MAVGTFVRGRRSRYGLFLMGASSQPAPTRLALRLGVSLALGLAAAGCQRLAVEDPSDSWTDLPDDTGVGTFAQDDDDGADDGGLQTGCNPVAQTGCSPGEKCTAVQVSGNQEAHACVSDPGGLEPFDPCNASLNDGIDGCPAGFVCLEGADGGACVNLCLTNSDCDDGICVYHSTDNIRHCAAECSAFEPSCVSPLECRRASDRFVCKFPSHGDTGTQGSPCEAEEDFGCAGGFACLPGPIVLGCTDSSCCTSLCELSDSDPCPQPSTCNALFPNPAPGFADVGACFVPA
jgi:hypothetical protein